AFIPQALAPILSPSDFGPGHRALLRIDPIRRNHNWLKSLSFFFSQTLRGSPSAVECLVREMSDTGARIKFSTPPPPIDFLELNIPIKGRNFSAKVIWRAEDEIGVAFEADSAAGNAEANDSELSDRVARLEGEIAMLKQLIKLLQKPSNIKTEAA
ncbi:MAG: hypothetical protein EXQ82_09060, partial [Pseudolabrys sp.]|nr:hypothetical protein [Pseudolabrys sp.]